VTCNSGRRSYESSFHQIMPYFAEFANFTIVQNEYSLARQTISLDFKTGETGENGEMPLLSESFCDTI